MNNSVLLAACLSLASWTVAASEPPQVTYVSNFPSADGFEWSELQNGVTHDDSNWFLTQETRLWKIPVSWRLDNDFSVDDLPAGVFTVGIPQELRDCKYTHFGDLEQLDGFLLIPVEQTETPPSGRGCPSSNALAVFRAADLSYVGSALLPAIPGETPARFPVRFPWIAFNPVDGLLYTSENTIANDRPLYRLAINRAALLQACGASNATCDSFSTLDYGASLNDLAPFFTFKDTWPIYESDGSPLVQKLGRYIQGGDFSEKGFLYISNGKTGAPSIEDPDSFSDYRNGIHVVDPAGRIVADSYNPAQDCAFGLVCRTRDPLGSFRFEFDPEFPELEEPEGLDWWDLDDGRAPGVRGQLHVMLLANQVGTDDIFFKHYRVVESGCSTDCDRDGDGLTDAEEAALGTNPALPDSDGDGLIDGNEVNDYHTDPLDGDSDDDGLTDGSEIGLYLTDPTSSDSDGDGLSDGREINDLHTNPLDVDSDDDGLADGRDVEFVEQQLLAILDSAFRSRGPGAREQLLQHLTVLESAVQANNFVAATAALNVLLGMVDGCGMTPDANDVVRDCASQPALRELLALLRLNLGLI